MATETEIQTVQAEIVEENERHVRRRARAAPAPDLEDRVREMMARAAWRRARVAAD